MISPETFYHSLTEAGVDCYVGVPDSLLKYFISYVQQNSKQHRIMPNEGSAIAFASGYYLATQKPALVYLQNSGIGNTINPLCSLADPEIYSIPMILLIGWRGMPKHSDEPQHQKQGRITIDLLRTLEIPHFIIDSLRFDAQIKQALKMAQQQLKPVALVVPPDSFEPKDLLNPITTKNTDITRFQALSYLLTHVPEKARIVSTTGYTSRELYELREQNSHSHAHDFLMVGAMGHASHLALGLSMHSEYPIYCLDGDGALLMHMGALTSIGQSNAVNFYHILLNNSAHDSVGAQPTLAGSINWISMAHACGYKYACSVSTWRELDTVFNLFKNQAGPCFLEIKIACGTLKNLKRPTLSPGQNKKDFMQALSLP